VKSLLIKNQNFFVGLLLTLLTIIITLIIAEIILRFTPYKNIGLSYKYPAQYFIADDEMGYDIRQNRKGAIHNLPDHPYEVFSNSYGCFDYERKVPNNYGLIVGDSFTWGYSPLDDKWTSYLEKKSGIFMMKCGITGHGTLQEMKKAKRVIKAIGKNPKYVIVLYTANDFNDDFFFPGRTVIGDGTLVSKNKGANFITGERFFYSQEEQEERKKKYMSFKYSLVTYRIFLSASTQIKNKFEEFLSHKNPTARSDMPDFITNYYGICLASYFNYTDREWYNQALEQHLKNIKDFALYSRSIGAKFLFIDLSGTLQNPRIDNLKKFFASHQGMYFYDLSTDYKNPSHWKHDSHWDIKGNQEAGEFIYQNFKKAGVFE